MGRSRPAADEPATAWTERARLAPSALAQLLKDEISAGRYAVGGLIPTELELQQAYSVSRYCVREALRILKDSGMVSGRAGIGHTVLAAEPARDRYMQGSMTLTELVQSTGTVLHVVSAKEAVIDAAQAALTGFAEGDAVVEVMALRTQSGAEMPTALLSISLRPAHAMMVRYMEGEAEPFHIMLERRYGVQIDAVEQRIVAVKAGAGSARLLKASAGQPCLRIARRFLDAGGATIFCSVGLYPGDRFSHDTAFKVRR